MPQKFTFLFFSFLKNFVIDLFPREQVSLSHEISHKEKIRMLNFDSKSGDGSADLEHAVINARRHLVDVRKRRDDAKIALQRLKHECDSARNAEDSLFRQLVECEREIHNLFRELVDTPSALLMKPDDGSSSTNHEKKDLFKANASGAVSLDDNVLMNLISLRTQEEENTLRRLQDDLEATEREYQKVSKLSQVQRAEMLRLVKSVAREYRSLEATTAREESELFRLRQETQDVIARTQSNKVRIVKDLFQL